MFDIQETTIQIDHTNKRVEFYTTKRSVFLALVHRNPNVITAKELNPGYEVVYPLDQCRSGEDFVRLADGSIRGLFLTDEEKRNLEASAARLKAAHAAKEAG